MKLYHGSMENIQEEFLQPNKPFKTFFYDKPLLYFTDKYENALLYSINPIRQYIKDTKKSGTANAFSNYFKFDNKKNILIVYECYKGMLKETYNNPAYIYEAEVHVSEKNNDNTGYVFETPIKYDKKHYIANVLDELLKLEKENKIKIIHFEELSEDDKYHLYDSISCRANSCESEAEVAFFKEKLANIYEVQKYIKLNSIKN